MSGAFSFIHIILHNGNEGCRGTPVCRYSFSAIPFSFSRLHCRILLVSPHKIALVNGLWWASTAIILCMAALKQTPVTDLPSNCDITFFSRVLTDCKTSSGFCSTFSEDDWMVLQEDVSDSSTSLLFLKAITFIFEVPISAPIIIDMCNWVEVKLSCLAFIASKYS